MACRFEINVKSILMKGLNLDFEKKFVDYFQGVKTFFECFARANFEYSWN